MGIAGHAGLVEHTFRPRIPVSAQRARGYILPLMSRAEPERRSPWIPILVVAAVLALGVWIAIASAPHLSRPRVEMFLRSAGAGGACLLSALRVGQTLIG